MNALTKAFVVVVTILAVILVALVVPFAARVPDYAQKYQDLKNSEKAALEEKTQAIAEIRKELSDAGDASAKQLQEIQAKDETIAQQSVEISGLQGQLAQSETTTARAAAALEVASRANEAQNKQIAEMAKLIQEQIASLGELQALNTELNQAIIKTRSDNSRLSTNYLRVLEQLKAKEQQLSEAIQKFEQAVQTAKGHGVDLTESSEVLVAGGLEIRGAVTQIQQIENMTFVQINVGTRDKVQKGMEFTVYRGDSFVGKIQITAVDTAEAVGQLTLGGGVQEGDAIRTGGQ